MYLAGWFQNSRVNLGPRRPRAVCSIPARRAGRRGASGEEPRPSGERRGLSGSFPPGLSREEGEGRSAETPPLRAEGVGLRSSQAPEVCGSLKR